MRDESRWQGQKPGVLGLDELACDLIDKKTCDRCQEVFRTKHLDEANEEAVSAMARNVIRRVCKDAENVCKVADDLLLRVRTPAMVLDQSRHDAFDGLVDDTGAVSIVPLKYVRAHEGEDGHDVLDDLLGHKGDKVGDETESLVRRLRVVRNCRFRKMKSTSDTVRAGNHRRYVLRMISKTGLIRTESSTFAFSVASLPATLPRAVITS